ncbi:hypothetical protein C5167_022023 [Papaver somniferum]|uniref:DUF3615 domain-containing protein n=1 Tax=Papaver somniferum TaxID=3469 RepID=A0A4Y7JI83_PAPSO|nr:hypothetical protein C5167_022023 [Papaver somniferum]
MDAISFYSEITGTKYELVEPGYIAHVLLLKCLVRHLDFTAKKTDVDDAPEEIFFAELTTINKEIKTMAAHPRDGGFMAGGAGLFRDEPNDIPRKERTSTDSHDVVRPYAVDAITWLHYACGYRTCFLHHLDFTAKKTDVADAPEEMFFAELTTTNKVRCVKACRCMGPKIVISVFSIRGVEDSSLAVLDYSVIYKNYIPWLLAVNFL